MNRILLHLLFIFSVNAQLLAQTQGNAFPLGPAWGDQGDGSYLNPVLFANFPDSDIERVGDTYYMISSTIHLSPGMVILSSQDLVNWSYVGYVFKDISWHPKYGPDQMDGYGRGTWAGDLCRIDDRWYCYMIDYDIGLFVTSAPHPVGPWEPPVLMKEMSHATDPAAYFDEETGEAYLIMNMGEFLSLNSQNEDESILYPTDQRLFKLGKDRKSLADTGQTVYTGPRSEACKIYKVDGQWFILTVDWTETEEHQLLDRKQICLRSMTNSIYGPYERKVVMEQGNGIQNSACQGSLLQVPDGSWWYLHQLVQNGPNYWGRPQMLEPVKWINGWPIIGEDIDDDGIGEPVYSGRMPIQVEDGNKLQTNDFFDHPELGLQWNWTMDPAADRWSLIENPGNLRLYAGKPVNMGGFWNASNTISQRLMGNGKGVATAELNIEGIAEDQVTGLCRFSDDFAILGPALKDGEKRVRMICGTEIFWGPVIKGDLLWVRTSNSGPTTTFSYSLDGKTWTVILEEGFYLPGFKKWMGDRIGFCSFNEIKEKGFLDIAWFTYEHNIED
jgi:beta-xylosidase